MEKWNPACVLQRGLTAESWARLLHRRDDAQVGINHIDQLAPVRAKTVDGADHHGKFGGDPLAHADDFQLAVVGSLERREVGAWDVSRPFRKNGDETHHFPLGVDGRSSVGRHDTFKVQRHTSSPLVTSDSNEPVR